MNVPLLPSSVSASRTLTHKRGWQAAETLFTSPETVAEADQIPRLINILNLA